MYYLLGARPQSPNRLQPWPGDIPLSKKWWPCRSYQNEKYVQCSMHYIEASGTLIDFAEYVTSTWINGSTWAPTDWTCYKQAIRMNNDMEGWHNGLNRRASGRAQLPMYFLIQLLYREVKLTAIQIRLVSERKLRRIQRWKHRELQQRIFELWDQYEAGERSARRLLKACSYLNGTVEL